MEEKEYLQTLGEQILNPHARTHVLEEIQEHIDEQIQDYIDTGMSPDAAEKEAVRQMGDPVAAGTELNRIHRPRFPGFVRHCGGSYIIRNFHAIYPVWF